jgi:DNA-binding LacI/PurR family transcriptional regulator
MNETPIKTIEDIARLAGVSKSTVSRALNDSPLIGVETKERIREIAREHRFERNDSARRLSLGQSHVVALVTYDYSGKFTQPTSFVLELMSGISAGLHANGYDLLIIQVAPNDTDWISRYLESGRVDGFVLMSGSCSQRHLTTLMERNAPFITFGIPAGKRGYSWVTGDNFTGGKLATEHLIAGGRKRVGFIGGTPAMVDVQDRYEGYAAALGEAGRAVEPELVVYADFTPESGAEAMRTLLSAAPDIDGVFVNSDLMAIAAIEELRALGRSVPDDIAVVGYDDVELAAHSDPPLTTISQNIVVAGRMLAENLLHLVRTGVVANVLLPAELVVRKSA